MKTFEYTAPQNTDEAMLRLGSDPGARILAGGTNLVDLMK